MRDAKLKLGEIAKRILAHLQRFEADAKINKPVDHGGMRLKPYYCVNAYHAGSRIAIQYVSYQGSTCLSRDEALRYLAWLDAGNVGKHWACIDLVLS